MRIKKPKFKNKRCTYNGHTFDSLGERNRFMQLELMEKAGLIANLVPHPSFKLMVARIEDDKPTGEVTAIGKYTPDFQYTDLETGEHVVEDFKSPATANTVPFKRTVKHMAAQYGITVKVSMKNRRTA